MPHVRKSKKPSPKKPSLLARLTENRYPSFEEKFGREGRMGSPRHIIKPDRRRPVRLAILLMLLLALCATLILFLSPLMKVTAIEAQDGIRYSKETILENAGISVGDPLLGFDSAQVERTLMDKLPLLASVKVGKSLDGTVSITVREEGVLYYTEHYRNYYLISAETLRVVSVTSYAQECLQVGAIYVGLPEEARLHVGDTLTFDYLPYPPENADSEASTFEVDTAEPEQAFSYVTDTLRAVMDSSIGRYVTGVELGDRYNLWFVLQGRILVRLGTTDELPRKLSQSMEVLMKQENLDARAVLDASDPSRITYREDPALELPVWATDSMP